MQPSDAGYFSAYDKFMLEFAETAWFSAENRDKILHSEEATVSLSFKPWSWVCGSILLYDNIIYSWDGAAVDRNFVGRNTEPSAIQDPSWTDAFISPVLFELEKIV